VLSKFFLFYILYWILGNPLLVILILLVLYFTIDRTFFGFIPDPFKAFKKAGRIRELQRIIAINPHDSRSLKELGIYMIEKKDFRKAREYLEQAAGKLSTDPEFNYYYGISVARSGDVEGGWQLVDDALAHSPGLKYGDPLIGFAEIYIDNGDYSSALPLLERFENIHSSSSRGFYLMGVVKLKLGEKESGIDYLRKAITVFKASPRFKRKVDRRWAWKARALLRKT
jgi:tetratricopeptide (TPR) repeat protein